MSKPTTKVWGTTKAILIAPTYELHGLCIRPNHRCSLHVHRFKSNGFTVLSGHLYIDVLMRVIQDEYEFETAKLGTGDDFKVEPGIYHRFRTGMEGAEALEWYIASGPLTEDIERLDVGGSVEQP